MTRPTYKYPESLDPEVINILLMSIGSRRDIAALLGVTYSQLTYLLYRSPESLRYTEFVIPKRSGGERRIMAPNKSLKLLQAKLAQIFSLIYRPKPSAHGFVDGRSIVTNASYHCNRQYIFNVDLKDFFPSINFGRVRGMLMAKPYRMSKVVATTFAQICCFKNQLPQGAPTSPIVSNMICAPMDAALQRLAKEHKCRYTRYADDLTFSTYLHDFPEQIGRSEIDGVAKAGPALEKLIKRNGFAINAEKTYIQRFDSHQEVTGLTVNRKPNVPRRLIRQVRAMLHAWKKFGLEAAENEHNEKYRAGIHRNQNRKPPSFKSVVSGKIAYISMVRGYHDTIAAKFRTQFEHLVNEESLDDESVSADSSLPMTTPDRIRAAMWVLECDEQDTQGTAFMLQDRGFVTCEHVLCKHVAAGKLKAFRPELTSARYAVSVISSNKDVDLAVVDIAMGEGEKNKYFALEMRLDDKGLKDQAEVMVGGFPNYCLGDEGHVVPGQVIGHRMVSAIKRAQVNASIVTGASGGPVVDTDGAVVGVAVTGADLYRKSPRTEDHGVIPIQALEHVLK